MKSNTIEIEFDTPKNANVCFQPLTRTFRGRFDVRRMKDGGRLFSTWPEPIPGQRLSVNFDSGECEIIEPLWEPAFAAIRERIERKGMTIAPGREPAKLDPATAHHWLKGLIETGDCKIVSGELPAKVEGKPQLRFHSVEQLDPVESSIVALTSAIQQQTDLLGKLLSKLSDR